MANPPSPEELRAAWQAMRHRPALRHWPQDFAQVMGDRLRALCVAIEATAACRRRPGKPIWMGIDHASGPDKTSYWRPPNPSHPPNHTDLKRAAAGDLDD